MYKKKKIKRDSSFYSANSIPQVREGKLTKYLRKESVNEGIYRPPRILYLWKYETKILFSPSSLWSIKSANSFDHVINQRLLLTWALLEKTINRWKTLAKQNGRQNFGRRLGSETTYLSAKLRKKQRQEEGL